jgi:hypothetical protein
MMVHRLQIYPPHETVAGNLGHAFNVGLFRLRVRGLTIGKGSLVHVFCLPTIAASSWRGRTDKTSVRRLPPRGHLLVLVPGRILVPLGDLAAAEVALRVQPGPVVQD